ncbi:KH domain-containing protein [Thermodesulfobacteriota bacterium]
METEELLYKIVTHLVDNPEAVHLNKIEGEQNSILELSVAKEDIGKVIGKKGRTANAIRNILSAASAKLNKRTILEILE